MNPKSKSLIFLAVVLLLAGTSQIGCKDTPTTPTDPTAMQFASSVEQAHNHTITIQKTEIDTPPASGISRETSSAGHTHTFAMSQAELQTVQGGTAVVVTTSVTDGHAHTFTIAKWY